MLHMYASVAGRSSIIFPVYTSVSGANSAGQKGKL